MPNGKGIAFPDASYNYRRGIRRPVTPANVPGEPEETAGSCSCQYPAAWRNRFWPEFAHPRWLCCKELYNEKNG